MLLENNMFVIFSVIVLAFFTSIVYMVSDTGRYRNTLKMSFKEALDLTNIPIITFTNNERKLNFILDTGADYSYINKSALNGLSFKSGDDSLSVHGVTEMHTSQETCKSCTMQIKYHKETYDCSFYIMNLDDSFRFIKEANGVTVHGVLGSKFFEKYKYVLDFEKLAVYAKKH